MKHSHSYVGTTSFDDCHVHHYGGVTSKSPSGVPHTHCLKGETTYLDDHDHDYETKTGPAIVLHDGLHYHYYETRVRCADGHIHYICGCTSTD
ncbi:YmaF family protein [Clostridium sp. HMP27]|uniref:YmaF family protein n=1 Tax=Clostridium sp. HMP27 TaxID=1487921 RepID=UPI00052B57B4|nr:YmaF family protein [Clostridium sp. HMP27]KGK81740.1 hypothetical protein DP68_18100 [Clostridium sp. HMP27]